MHPMTFDPNASHPIAAPEMFKAAEKYFGRPNVAHGFKLLGGALQILVDYLSASGKVKDHPHVVAHRFKGQVIRNMADAEIEQVLLASEFSLPAARFVIDQISVHERQPTKELGIERQARTMEEIDVESIGGLTKRIVAEIQSAIRSADNQEALADGFERILLDFVYRQAEEFAKEINLQRIVAEAKARQTESLSYIRQQVYQSRTKGGEFEFVIIGYLKNGALPAGGQHNPIHDHGDNVCCYLILDSVGKEYQFKLVEEEGETAGLLLSKISVVEPGHTAKITAEKNPIHVVGNFGLSDYTVEIAIYHEPLSKRGIRIFSPVDIGLERALTEGYEGMSFQARKSRFKPQAQAGWAAGVRDTPSRDMKLKGV
jgi:hypothetical protein